MLQSFGYASAVSSGEAGPTHTRQRELHHAFRRGYFAETAGRSGLLPESSRSTDMILALFQIEKSFYELQYEIDHRPDWMWIPVGRLPLYSAP